MKAVNLIPAAQRTGAVSPAGESNGAAYIVLGVVAGAAVLALLYGIARHQVSSRKGEIAKVTAEAQATQARASQLAPYVSFSGMYQQRLQAVSELAGTRFDWAHAFHELGRVLPHDASLSSVHGTIGSATVSSSSSSSSASASVTSATPPGAVPTFSLAGCATSQSEVAQTLQRLRLIDGVSAVSLQSSTKSGGSGGSSSGSCPPDDPAFAITVTFSPLPTPPAPSSAASGSSTQPAADTSSTAASTSASSSKGAQ
jgi:Tfp pilus assembly protein PilN